MSGHSLLALSLHKEHRIFMLEGPVTFSYKWSTGQDNRIGDQSAILHLMFLLHCKKEKENKNLKLNRSLWPNDGCVVWDDGLMLTNNSLTLLNDNRTVPYIRHNWTDDNCVLRNHGRAFPNDNLTLPSDGRAVL